MIADETKAIDFGDSVLDHTGQIFFHFFPDKQVLIIADENTYAAAGDAVLNCLKDAGVRMADEPLIFPGRPTLYADYDNVVIVRDRLAALPDAVACSIAAGTLNDIVKLASAEVGRPYINVCTAASVDGYSAFGASISRDGFKITRPCPAPIALIADVDVLVHAPQRLTSTGYGDLIEKIPAGADWILADALGLDPINEDAWEIVQAPLRTALDHPDLIACSDRGAVTELAQCNLLSGLAMQATKSSRPASGAGHQFSHVWEMEGHGLDWEPPLSHGFKVAVGTVASCALWQAALSLDLRNLDIGKLVETAPDDATIRDRVVSLLPPQVAEEALEISLAKNLRGEALRQRLYDIQASWDLVKHRVRNQLLPPDQVARMLSAAGAPYHPNMIGITMDHFRTTHFTAQMIRARYTILDLLADLQMLSGVVDRLFSADGYWGGVTGEAAHGTP